MDLFQVFTRLRVVPFSTPLDLKLTTLALFKGRRDLHKQFGAYACKLLLGRLDAPAFMLMCAVYDVPILLVVGKAFYRWGSPTHAVRDGTIVRAFDTSHLFEICLAKPLYAISHYTLTDLTAMAEQLGLQGRTKTVLYEQIKDNVNLMLK